MLIHIPKPMQLKGFWAKLFEDDNEEIDHHGIPYRFNGRPGRRLEIHLMDMDSGPGSTRITMPEITWRVIDQIVEKANGDARTRAEVIVDYNSVRYSQLGTASFDVVYRTPTAAHAAARTLRAYFATGGNARSYNIFVD